MRRSDREVTNKSEIIEILDKCEVCRLAFSSNDVPYIVPMNYGYDYRDEKLTLYFHGASEGKKHDVMNANPIVCFEMDCSHKLIEDEKAENYTMEYESVIGLGKTEKCDNNAEKAHALTQLMKKYANDRAFTFPDHVLNSVTVFKVNVTEFTGKRLTVS